MTDCFKKCQRKVRKKFTTNDSHFYGHVKKQWDMSEIKFRVVLVNWKWKQKGNISGLQFECNSLCKAHTQLHVIADWKANTDDWVDSSIIGEC